MASDQGKNKIKKKRIPKKQSKDKIATTADNTTKKEPISSKKDQVESPTKSQPTKKQKPKKKKNKTKIVEDIGSAKKTKKSKRDEEKEDVLLAKAISSEEKRKIDHVLKEDAAIALGAAIRDRAEELLSGGDHHQNSVLDRMDRTMASLGWGLGASDQLKSSLDNHHRHHPKTAPDFVDDETGGGGGGGGGVQTSTTAVLVHYFLKSHGGAHAFQCVCSLLATLTGMAVLLTSTTTMTNNMGRKSPWTLFWMRRCLTLAMMKHISGMLAASFLAARAIPQVGFRKARVWIRDLVRDPVSQYVFYTASLLFWLRTDGWWQAYRFIPILIVGPILLRESIHTIFVLSDVLLLWLCTSPNDSSSEKKVVAVIQRILRWAGGAIDAIMSIIVTPDIWRSADPLQRQAILAKLTSRLSLAMEVLVALLLSVDALVLLIAYTLYRPTTKPNFWTLVKTMLCAHLYVQFLWVRQRKISKLLTQVRGGAAPFVLYVLDVLLDPMAAMGLTNTTTTSDSQKDFTFPMDLFGKNRL